MKNFFDKQKTDVMSNEIIRNMTLTSIFDVPECNEGIKRKKRTIQILVFKRKHFSWMVKIDEHIIFFTLLKLT